MTPHIAPFAPRLRHLFATLICSIALFGCASTDQQIDSGLWHYKAGLSGEAIPRLVSGVESLEATRPSDPRLPQAYLALGDMAVRDKRPDLAETYYKRSLESVTKYHATNDRLVRNTAVEAGNFYLAQRRFREAEPLLMRATEISSKFTPATKLHVSDLDNLSLAVEGAGRLDEADALSDKALVVLATLPSSKENVATRGVVFYNRAYRCAKRGQYVMAESYYRRALADIASSAEPWRVKVVRTQFADFLRKQGRAAEANEVEPSHL